MMKQIALSAALALVFSTQALAFDYFHCNTELTDTQGKKFTSQFGFVVTDYDREILFGPLGGYIVGMELSPAEDYENSPKRITTLIYYNGDSQDLIRDAGKDRIDQSIYAKTDFTIDYSWTTVGKIHVQCEARER